MFENMPSVVPEVDAMLVRVAENQEEYLPITAALVKHPAYPPGVASNCANSHLLAFRPTENQRRRIAEGADIYVSLLTGGGSMQGIIVMAGKEEASAIYNIKTVEVPA